MLFSRYGIQVHSRESAVCAGLPVDSQTRLVVVCPTVYILSENGKTMYRRAVRQLNASGSLRRETEVLDGLLKVPGTTFKEAAIYIQKLFKNMHLAETVSVDGIFVPVQHGRSRGMLHYVAVAAAFDTDVSADCYIALARSEHAEVGGSVNVDLESGTCRIQTGVLYLSRQGLDQVLEFYEDSPTKHTADKLWEAAKSIRSAHRSELKEFTLNAGKLVPAADFKTGRHGRTLNFIQWEDGLPTAGATIRVAAVDIGLWVECIAIEREYTAVTARTDKVETANPNDTPVSMRAVPAIVPPPEPATPDLLSAGMAQAGTNKWAHLAAEAKALRENNEQAVTAGLAHFVNLQTWVAPNEAVAAKVVQLTGHVPQAGGLKFEF